MESPLRHFARVRVVAASACLLAVIAIGVFLTARLSAARSFERTAQTARATVTGTLGYDDGNDPERLIVDAQIDGRTVEGRPVTDYIDDYAVGDDLVVLYRAGDPIRSMRLADEPYDPWFAGVAALAFAVVAIGLGGRAVSWPRRLRATAGSERPTYAMIARPFDDDGAADPRWVSLFPVDAGPVTPAVISYRLLGDLRLDQAAPVLVRGDVRDGGVVVARAGDTDLWPAKPAVVPKAGAVAPPPVPAGLRPPSLPSLPV